MATLSGIGTLFIDGQERAQVRYELVTEGTTAAGLLLGKFADLPETWRRGQRWILKLSDERMIGGYFSTVRTEMTVFYSTEYYTGY